MQTVLDFKDLIAWQKARDVTKAVYQMTPHFPTTERFGLVSQMRRASVSVNANIAEGFSRTSVREKLYFYSLAQGSLAELESHLLISLDLQFSEQAVVTTLIMQISEAQKILQGLISSTKKRLRAFSSS